jgi:SpoVK/Ycf46/Vps4 family AAA+-type ATPase
MKNDIDDILNSMFSDGKLTPKKERGPAEKEAEDFLNSISSDPKSESGGQKDLKKQLDDLNAINAAAQASMKELQKSLEADGLKDQTVKNEAAPEEKHASEEPDSADREQIMRRFDEAEKEAGTSVIGQDDFLHRLYISFKRPFVMGKEEGKPASVILIIGNNGTGRHMALGKVAETLSKRSIIGSPEISVIDLGTYSTSGDTKLFIQDMFSAFEKDSDIILFENYDRCHQSLLSMITELVTTGSIRLSSRYVLQKGILVDAGTALVPNAISTLTCHGEYLVFVTENSEAKITDAMGASFISAVKDICTTSAFSSESLAKIGQRETEALKLKSARMLDFDLTYGPEVPDYFSSRFTPDDGINAITGYTDLCYKTLSEYKLSENAGKCAVRMYVDSGILKFEIDGRIITNEKGSAPGRSALDEVKKQMEEIVGLSTVKDYIFSLEENYKVQQMRREKGMKVSPPSMHMIFTGNPGTGKTTIARLVSRYLKAIGVLSGGQLIEVTRADLVGRYVGHTAPLTQQVIQSAIGGVLFIDEAYSLYRGSDDSFGLEAIDTLVKGMEDNRENLVVILAGYTREMSEFLTANSGLKSRFPNIIEFPDYTAEELLAITKVLVKGKGYVLSDECDAPLLTYYTRKQAEDARENGNGRMARNLVESAIINQSKRLIAEKNEDFTTILLRDFDFNN